MVDRRPELLRGRVPCGQEEFLAWHFPTGERRDVARQLWRLLEDHFTLDLRGLHPDDDLQVLLGGSRYDSLDFVELAMAFEDLVDAEAADDGVEQHLVERLGTFRQIVDRMARNARRSD